MIIPMTGVVWQSDGTGIGRDLRAPPPRRVWDRADYPASYAMDRTLAGADEPPPAAIYRASPPDLPAGQMYDKPRRADIHRDLGAAQVVRKAARKPAQLHQHDDEVPDEKNPPPHHAFGFRVVRDHGGSAQTLPVHVDRGFADYVGHEYFRDGEPSPAPRSRLRELRKDARNYGPWRRA